MDIQSNPILSNLEIQIILVLVNSWVNNAVYLDLASDTNI